MIHNNLIGIYKRTLSAVALSAMTSLSVFSQQQDAESRDWELSFGGEGLSFYAGASENILMSHSPFNPDRLAYGASMSVGKWLSPSWAVRTKGYGYWGKAVSEDAMKPVHFYYIEEQVMCDAINLFSAIKKVNRPYNIIPFGGVGFARNCEYNSNAFAVSGGLRNVFRVSDHVGILLDVSGNLAIGNKNEKIPFFSGKTGWLAAEAGLTFNLGSPKRSRSTATDNEIIPGNFRYREKIQMDSIGRVITGGENPRGMVHIRRGHIRLGTQNVDSLWGVATPMREVSIDDFWMDKHEVSNRMYRLFVKDVVNSIIEERMQDPYFMGNKDRVMASLYRTNPVTGEKELDTKQLVYAYEVYDYIGAAMRQNRLDPSERNLNTDIKPDPNDVVMISKDTAYVDNKGNIVRETITRPLSGPYDFLNTYVVNVYPDTTVWINDFPKADNIMYMKYYFSHKDYDDYPVVGVSWEQANAYCAWRTEQLKEALGGKLGDIQPYRLPSEAEWEYAARGKTQNEFPWEECMSGNGMQALYANFMPDDGDYTRDGNIITSKVGTYPANSNGLYDMAGNVAEWTSTSFTESGVEGMNNINPQHAYNAAYDDPYRMKTKTVKGGSWKDSESHIMSAWRSYEYQNQPRSYIGFRCVRSIATKPSEKTFLVK